MHYEFFGPATVLGAAKSAGDGSAPSARDGGEASTGSETFTVRFARSGVDATWNPDSGSLLDLAEASGLSPEFSCRSGICQTCSSKLDRGEVEYTQEPLEDPGEGQVLICCSWPRSDLTLQI